LEALSVVIAPPLSKEVDLIEALAKLEKLLSAPREVKVIGIPGLI
jgi:hypothetical protein